MYVYISPVALRQRDSDSESWECVNSIWGESDNSSYDCYSFFR